MTKKIQLTKKVELAFCEELGRNLTIDEAGVESEKRGWQRFSFLCSSPECKKQNIPITGAIYCIDPEKRWTTMTPHFKINSSHQEHHQNCEWVIGYAEAAEHTTHNSSSDTSRADITKANYKQDRHINIFIPPILSDLDALSDNNTNGTKTAIATTSSSLHSNNGGSQSNVSVR